LELDYRTIAKQMARVYSKILPKDQADTTKEV
jgi:hypothetical protein